MNRRIWSTVISAIFLIASSACSKNRAAPQVIVEIPSGFTGNFLLEMGVRDALPLENRGEAYVLLRAQEREGHHVDSADQLPAIIPEFQRRCCVGLFAFGFYHGRRIPVGAKIEFFVGTRNEYEAEQGRKKHSGGLLTPAEPILPAA